jgi:hypothetical protein
LIGADIDYRADPHRPQSERVVAWDLRETLNIESESLGTFPNNKFGFLLKRS